VQRKRLCEPFAALVRDLNLKIRGWATYYGYGTASWRFSDLDSYIWQRLLLFLNSNLHQRLVPRRSRLVGKPIDSAGSLVIRAAAESDSPLISRQAHGRMRIPAVNR